MSKVAILLNDVANSVDPSDLDVLTQARQIGEALERQGHEPAFITCSMDLASARSELEGCSPYVVFNLVESLGGSDRLMAAATLLLDSMHLPYTGADSHAILLSGDKLQAKCAMAAAGIATPSWFDCISGTWRSTSGSLAASPPMTIITKAKDEHASFALENDAVMAFESNTQVRHILHERLTATGRVHLTEEFVAGREFNLSLLEIDGQPHVLAPAEIDFDGLPAFLPQIVGTRAKWQKDSDEYQLTPRRFNFLPHDRHLIAELSNLAVRCWNLLGVRGYARVDFRVDANSRPYVLEVNANPCLSQDAGFIAAAEQSRIAYDQVIEHILEAAIRPKLLHQRAFLARTGEVG